jgi:hypothetical protein
VEGGKETKMTDKIRFLKEKGKYVSKDDLAFYSQATLEQLERAESNAVLARHLWYEEMERAGTYGPDNPPPASGLDYHRWLLKKHGLKWYVAYAKRREYAGDPAGIPGRLRAMGVSEAEIEAVANPLAAMRKKNSKIFSIANRLAKTMGRQDAFRYARSLVGIGSLSVKVAGVTFGNRQEALRRLEKYQASQIKAAIVPEPENPVDKGALAVMVGIEGGNGMYKLGYVPALNLPVVRAVSPGNISFEILPGTVYGARLTLAVA